MISTQGQYNIGLQYSASSGASASPSMASSAPEAGDLVMSLMGLAGVGLLLRRQKSSQKARQATPAA
jgi:hypothetical protein